MLFRSLGNTSPGLSMAEFRDLYTIYAMDLSAQAIVSPTNQLTINEIGRASCRERVCQYV